MAKMMMTLQSKGVVPTLETVRQRYGLNADEIDASFGVVEIDPADGAYAVMVEESALAKLGQGGKRGIGGPFSNPKIEPFGPPRTEGDPEDPKL